MRIKYWDEEIIDCTADPHHVSYANQGEMLRDTLKVCESTLVDKITQVILSYDDKNEDEYESDYLSDSAYGMRIKIEGKEAVDNKVSGLYFEKGLSESKLSGRRHLDPGIRGVREALKIIEERGEIFEELSIGVVWRAFAQHSCSDYITVKPGEGYVNYSNQDWYVDGPEYEGHIEALSEFLGVEITGYDGGD